MSARNGRMPAYPSVFPNHGDRNAEAPDGEIVPPGCTHHLPGLTKREAIAAGIWAQRAGMPGWTAQVVVQMADDLLAALDGAP